jgi:hypothetical protein
LSIRGRVVEADVRTTSVDTVDADRGHGAVVAERDPVEAGLEAGDELPARAHEDEPNLFRSPPRLDAAAGRVVAVDAVLEDVHPVEAAGSGVHGDSVVRGSTETPLSSIVGRPSR